MDQLLIITGSMGSGKTAVLSEAADILTLRKIAFAAIDVDHLGLANLPSAASDAVMYANLRSISKNYADLGVRRFLLARALEDRAELDLCRQAVPAMHTTVCRLTAGLETMQRRIAIRETGMLQQKFVARVAELERILDRARLEDFVVSNDNRLLAEVTLEILVKAAWISGPPPTAE